MKFRTEKEQDKTKKKQKNSQNPSQNKSQFFEKNNKLDKLQTDKGKKRYNYRYQE